MIINVYENDTKYHLNSRKFIRAYNKFSYIISIQYLISIT